MSNQSAPIFAATAYFAASKLCRTATAAALSLKSAFELASGQTYMRHHANKLNLDPLDNQTSTRRAIAILVPGAFATGLLVSQAPPALLYLALPTMLLSTLWAHALVKTGQRYAHASRPPRP